MNEREVEVHGKGGVRGNGVGWEKGWQSSSAAFTRTTVVEHV